MASLMFLHLIESGSCLLEPAERAVFEQMLKDPNTMMHMRALNYSIPSTAVELIDTVDDPLVRVRFLLLIAAG